MPGVQNGTWSVFVDSGSNAAEIDNVTVAYNTMTSIPNASTTPAWPAVNANSVFLSSSSLVGIINGHLLAD